jgi:hypothetical protein
MKKIKTTDIVAGVRAMGAVKSTLDHLQEAFQDVFTDLIKGLINQQSGATVLYGCVDSDGSATAWNISAGAIYYDGEVYTIPAFIGTHVSQVPVLGIVTTHRTGDPIKFSDNNNYNVHEIRTMFWSLGASGSGLADFSAVNRFKDLIKPTSLAYGSGILKPYIVSIGSWDMVSQGSKTFNHGLPSGDFRKIRSVSAMIIQNNLNTIRTIEIDSGAVAGYLYDGSIANITNTTIQLLRRDGGVFDSTLFDGSTGIDPAYTTRGWVTFWLEM